MRLVPRNIGWLVLFAILAIYYTDSRADTWLDVSGLSYHFDRSTPHNERNWGVGIEVGVAKDTRLVAGAYRNSLWHIEPREPHVGITQYFGLSWLPLKAGPAHFGLLIGEANGYETHGGGWFPLAIPAASIEGNRFGLNVIAAPKRQGSPGVIGVQFKVKVWQ